MTTCKDCICYESCLNFAEMIGKNIVETITDGHYQCEFFKDRSRFVELPCKVYTTHLGRIVEAKICGYEASMKNSNYNWVIEPQHFGKYVFFTYEEAEKALKE